jgi:hypothetical protein
MVRTSVVKSPDLENNFTSHCNVLGASLIWRRLLGITKTVRFSLLSFVSQSFTLGAR